MLRAACAPRHLHFDERPDGVLYEGLWIMQTLGVRITDEKIASLKKVQNRGVALFLTENVCTSYQRGYCSAEEAQYLLVFCKPLCLTGCYF